MGKKTKKKLKGVDAGSYSVFLRHIVDCLRERCIQYCLEKSYKVDSLDEYRGVLKGELKKLHSKNMKSMDQDINHF